MKAKIGWIIFWLLVFAPMAVVYWAVCELRPEKK